MWVERRDVVWLAFLVFIIGIGVGGIIEQFFHVSELGWGKEESVKIKEVQVLYHDPKGEDVSSFTSEENISEVEVRDNGQVYIVTEDADGNKVETFFFPERLEVRVFHDGDFGK